MKKLRQRISSLVLVLALLISAAAGADAAAVPEVLAASKSYEARATKKNVLGFLDRYHKDGAYLVRQGDAISKKINGQRMTAYFDSNMRVSDVCNTVVHEMTHAYGYRSRRYDRTTYYLGNKKAITCKYTSTYRTKKMASSVPKRLRTNRYNVYVANKTSSSGVVSYYGDPSGESATDVYGAYGLLEEFVAYRMGLQNTNQSYSYYCTQKSDPGYALNFVTDGEDDKLSYAEFKYFILHYLLYAKKHYPKVYKGILGNKNFCKAYYRAEKSYKSQVSTYDKRVKSIGNKVKSKGDYWQVTSKNCLFMDASTGVYYQYTFQCKKDFDKLTKELKKSKYKSIHNALVKRGK